MGDIENPFSITREAPPDPNWRSLVFLRTIVILLVLVLSSRSVAADGCIQIGGRRIYTTDTGLYGLRLSTDRGTARGTLFSLHPDGKERVSWQEPLIAVRSRALVPPNGEGLVTLNTPCRMGFQHSLVIYGPRDGCSGTTGSKNY